MQRLPKLTLVVCTILLGFFSTSFTCQAQFYNNSAILKECAGHKYYADENYNDKQRELINDLSRINCSMFTVNFNVKTYYSTMIIRINGREHAMVTIDAIDPERHINSIDGICDFVNKISSNFSDTKVNIYRNPTATENDTPDLSTRCHTDK